LLRLSIYSHYVQETETARYTACKGGPQEVAPSGKISGKDLCYGRDKADL